MGHFEKKVTDVFDVFFALEQSGEVWLRTRRDDEQGTIPEEWRIASHVLRTG